MGIETYEIDVGRVFCSIRFSWNKNYINKRFDIKEYCMVSEFNLNSEIKDEMLLIKTSGYINNLGGEKIAEEYHKSKDSGIKKVVLDLKESNVVNSIGISYLIEIIENLNESNGKLYFVNLDPTIEKTFTIMGLFHFAEKVDSVDSV
jgi:anti-anti-sigma factor